MSFSAWMVLPLAILTAGAWTGSVQATSPQASMKAGISTQLANGSRWKAADHYEVACRGGVDGSCGLFESLMTLDRPSAGRFVRESRAFEAKCRKGDGKACFRFGTLFDSDRGTGIEPSRALSLYLKACKRGYTYACQRAAQLHVVLSGFGASRVRLRALTKKSCTGGYGESCTVLANLVKAGKGGPKSLPRSRALLRVACRRGQMAACKRLAKRTIWRAGKGKGKVTDAYRDLDPFVKSMTPACLAGHGRACGEVVSLLMSSLPQPRVVQARALTAQICAKGVGRLACAFAVDALKSAGGVPGTSTAARPWAQWVGAVSPTIKRFGIALLKRGCDDGMGRDCRLLATHHKGKTKAVVRFLTHAQEADTKFARLMRRYFQRRCQRDGSFVACFKLGGGLNGWLGKASAAEVKRVKARAEKLLKRHYADRAKTWRRGCRAGEHFACLQLAGLLERGHLGKKRPQEAAKLKARAAKLLAKLKARWQAASDARE